MKLKQIIEANGLWVLRNTSEPKFSAQNEDATFFINVYVTEHRYMVLHGNNPEAHELTECDIEYLEHEHEP